jgi:prefoldin subunit 5
MTELNNFLNEINKEISFYDMNISEIDQELLNLESQQNDLDDEYCDDLIFFQY